MPSVCPRCIEEPALAQFIKDNASEHECDYCGRSWKRPRAIPLAELMSLVRERVQQFYEDPAEHVAYESAEGGYQMSLTSSYDVLEDLGLGVSNQALMDDLAAGLPQSEWVKTNPYSLSEDDAMILSWEEFSRIVKHEVRYLLFPPKAKSLDEHEGVDASEMLDRLGDLFCSVGLFTVLKPGTRLYRLRVHAPGAAPANTMAALGPPPIDAARFPNRMSPAGISMLYTALDEATARAETYVRHDGQPAEATMATFEVTEEIALLDLANIPNVPSVFDAGGVSSDYETLIFLHAFVGDLTAPIAKDGREHIEYVPSQVVTEYVRYRLAAKAKKDIQGLLYNSSRRTGGVGCVLFVPYEELNATMFPMKPPFKLIEDLTKREPVDTAA